MKTPHLVLPALALSAAGLGHPAGADPPAVQPQAPAVSWHRLNMDSPAPTDVLKIMHWDAASSGGGSLPEGVRRILAPEGNRVLLVESTSEGFRRVWETIRTLHAPNRIQFKIQFVSAPTADILALHLFLEDDSRHRRIPSGAKAALALQSLLAGGGTVLKTYALSTGHGGTVSVRCWEKRGAPSPPLPPPTLKLIQGAPQGNAQPREVWLTIHPRLNSDETLGLILESPRAGYVLGDDGNETLEPSSRTLGILTKVPSGEVLAVGGLLTGQGNELLVFITPTLLPQKDTGNDSGQNRGMMSVGPNVSVAP